MHQVRAWSEAKGEDCYWKEYEEQINPLKTHGSRRNVNEPNMLGSNKCGNYKEYQIQRLKRN